MPASIARMLETCARNWPDKPVLLSDDGALDWTTVDRRAGAVAAGLMRQGIGHGDRVAIRLPDPAEVTVALFGVLKAGAAAAPMNPRLNAAELDRIQADLDPRLVIDALDGTEVDQPSVEVADDDIAIILYTSGSTGAPKGVLLSHAATAFALESWKGPVMDLRPDDISLSALPLAHSLGIFGSVLAPLLAGSAVAFLPHFTPEDALAAIARHRITVFPAVATMFRRILDCPALADSDLSSLRYALSGAAPCPWELAEEWEQATGARIIRGYGMTELFRPISYSAADPADMPDCIGRAVPGVELRIAGAGAGNSDAGDGEGGELLIRSPARLSGYLGRPDETAAVLDGEWFRTGDLAVIDSYGFVRITGRLKDIILRGGYSVAAGEVEAVLATHPDIAEAAVIGTPDRELGEEVSAFVVAIPGQILDSESVVAFCRDRMAPYKYPRIIRVLDRLPRGQTGKVMKGELRV